MISDHLSLLRDLEKIFIRRNLYIVGAGASVSFINPTTQLWYKKARELIQENVPFSGFDIDNDPSITKEEAIKLKIIGFPYPINCNIYNEKFYVDHSEFDFLSSHLTIKNVSLYKVQWNRFAYALFLANKFRLGSSKWSSSDISRFLFFYDTYSNFNEHIKNYNYSNNKIIHEHQYLLRLCKQKSIRW